VPVRGVVSVMSGEDVVSVMSAGNVVPVVPVVSAGVESVPDVGFEEEWEEGLA